MIIITRVSFNISVTVKALNLIHVYINQPMYSQTCINYIITPQVFLSIAPLIGRNIFAPVWEQLRLTHKSRSLSFALW